MTVEERSYDVVRAQVVASRDSLGWRGRHYPLLLELGVVLQVDFMRVVLKLGATVLSNHIDVEDFVNVGVRGHHGGFHRLAAWVDSCHFLDFGILKGHFSVY